MDKKPNDMDMQEVIKLANSPAGKALMAQLQQSHAEQVRQATQQAQQGSMDDATKTVRQMLSSPEIRKLLKQLGR